ncbi:MAG: alcohol dehydrogenase catalytic domain-containing protein [Calditrichota bacterium]
MKAVVKTMPQAGAEYIEVPIPQLRDDEVLIRVHATSICGTDVHIYNWDEWSARRIGAGRLPQILGHEFCGEIIDRGRSVEGLNRGDNVSAETHIYHEFDRQSILGQRHIGERMKILGVDINGCFAEYIAVPARVCWKNDKTIPPEFTCIQEPLGNATYAVLGEDSDVAGKSMLITGDGPVSLFAIAVAKACGVAKIIHFGFWDFNTELGKKLGADYQFITPRTTSAERLQGVLDLTEGYGVDIALEMVGTEDSINDCFAMVRKGGRITAFGIPSSGKVAIDYANGIVFKGCTIFGINGRRLFDTWYRNSNLLAMGKLDVTAVVTHVMDLKDYAAGFTAMLAAPRTSAKIVLFPDHEEYLKAAARLKRVDKFPS